MNSKNNTILYLVLGLLGGMLVMYLFNNYSIEKKNNNNHSTEINHSRSNNQSNENSSSTSSSSGNINDLTEESKVIDYVKSNHKLPDYYITKSAAKREGWIPSKGNLCEVLPGRAIGGDHFSNREGQLPNGDQYFEADVNYSCNNRNADRIIFTKNGDVWLTKNHYKSFEKQ